MRRAAKRLRIPRSRLYARALEAFVGSESDAEVTARLDEVHAKADRGADPAWQEASLAALRRSKW